MIRNKRSVDSKLDQCNTQLNEYNILIKKTQEVLDIVLKYIDKLDENFYLLNNENRTIKSTLTDQENHLNDLHQQIILMETELKDAHSTILQMTDCIEHYKVDKFDLQRTVGFLEKYIEIKKIG